MDAATDSKPYARFAALSLLLVIVVTTITMVLASLYVTHRAKNAAVSSANELVGAPLHAVFAAGGDAEDAQVSAEALVEPLLEGRLVAARVWGPDGFLYGGGSIAADGEDLPLTKSLDPARARASDGTPLLVSYLTKDGYTVEVAQASAPLDSATAATQRLILVAAILIGLLTWALLQPAFRLAIRSFTRQHGRLSYLFDTGHQLRASLDMHDVLTRLTRDATSLAQGRFGLVALLDETSGDLILRSTYDQMTGTVSQHQRALDEWFMRRCLATNTTVVNANGGDAFRQYLGPDAEIDAHASMLCVPLSLRDRAVGAIAIVGESGFNPSDIQLVEGLAAQAVTAVEQAQLFSKVRADADELESSYDSTLKALMAALDAKDEVTEGHSERVAKLTVHLAKSMDVQPSMLVHIERGALLHDVGKIGVPDAILKKPKALNNMEWEAMRKHPLLAGLMVSKVGFLEPALPILLYHHERFDGTGYPFGLSHENIPIEARIFTVIDAYDAMTSDRPYRPAMSHDEAMREVHANGGSQFDPDVVIAFDRLMTARPDLHDQLGHHRMTSMHDDEPMPDIFNAA